MIKMIKNHKIVKNISFLFIYQFVITVLSAILTIAIARQFGDAIFGRYSFATAITAIYVVFPIGLDTLMLREVSRNRENASKYLSHILISKLAFFLITNYLILSVLRSFHYSEETIYIVTIFNISMILSSMADTFKIIYQSFERMEFFSLTQVIRQTTITSLSLLVLHLNYDLSFIAFMFVIGSALDLIICYLITKNFSINFDFKMNKNFFKDLFIYSFPLSVIPLSSVIYIRANTMILSAMKGDEPVGWFNAAYGLVLMLRIVPEIVLLAFFPKLARTGMNPGESLRMIYQFLAKYLVMLGIPIVIGTSILAPKIILTIYGIKFSNSIIALQILSMDILLFFTYRLLQYILISINRQRETSIITFACAMINIILNFILIPSMSYIGSSLATVISESILLAAFFSIVSKSFYKLPIASITMKPIIASTLMAIFVYLLSSVNITILIPLALIIYISVLYLLNFFDKNEKEILLEVMED